MAHPTHDSMVRALRAACDRRAELPAMGANAARQAARFTWDNAANRLLGILKRVAA
jgi:glycosyltransferase involved in cell wall biosynthesis